MFVVDHQIAGINFRTESDIQIPGLLQSSRLRRFLLTSAKPNVYHRYRGIAPDTLILPPLNSKETELLTRCVRYPRGSVHSPLLCSPVVRTRLRACLNYPEQVGIELHDSSVVILDFARCELDTFYAFELEEDLTNSRVGHSLFTHFLTIFSAAMVHSAGLILDDAVALFLAPDEGGKTTVVKRASPGIVLGDDQNVLRKEGDVLTAYGTPWGSIISDPQKKARVGGFFLLEQAQRFELTLLEPTEVLEYLWNEHLSYRLFLPKPLRIRAFEILYDACHQAPTYRMRFPKGYIDWDAVDAAMVR